MFTALVALLVGLMGVGLGYLVGQRRLSIPSVSVSPPVVPTASIFCRVRIIGARAYHSYCPGHLRFDEFTVPAPGGIMKETGHWVAR